MHDTSSSAKRKLISIQNRQDRCARTVHVVLDDHVKAEGELFVGSEATDGNGLLIGGIEADTQDAREGAIACIGRVGERIECLRDLVELAALRRVDHGAIVSAKRRAKADIDARQRSGLIGKVALEGREDREAAALDDRRRLIARDALENCKQQRIEGLLDNRRLVGINRLHVKVSTHDARAT